MRKNIRRCHNFTKVYQKSWSHHVWLLRYKARWTEFFVILSHFFAYWKSSRYHHFILVYRKWPSYNVWFMRYWARQTKFHPTNKPENKILKNWRKNPPGDIILHKCAKNHDHMLYCSWDMARDGCNFYFSFWPTFCPFIPVTARKIKI